MPLWPFHHGGELPPDRDPFQRFLDSSEGILVASVLHTLGALLFTAGIILYLYLGHLIRKSQTANARPNLGLLNYAHSFTLVGILFNGVGGLMRLYESDHPGLDRLGDSTWVQVLLVKHLFIILGVVLALYLTWRTRNLTLNEATLPQLDRESPRMVGFAVASFATILLATVLGAVAAGVDLREDLGLPPLGEGSNQESPPTPPATGPREVANLSLSNTITGTPAQPTEQKTEFGVPEGTDRLFVSLAWSTSIAVLNLTLKNPKGEVAPATYKKDGTRWSLTVTGDAVVDGKWTFLVRADQAVQETYTLTAAATDLGQAAMFVEREVTIAGGKFFEANLKMDHGKALNYSWRVVESAEKIHFNLHLHVGNDVRYPVQGEWNRHEGGYNHTTHETHDVSLMWQNNGSAGLKVHFQIWGDFEVDSYYPASDGARGVQERAREAAAHDDEGGVGA